uniref:Plastid light harvesting protein n=1 Tax=Chromera velia CCMP2878 TaxID=1169474 RepID=A0A0G4FHA1_9ALVE|mmetsp:Transcript_55683/g.109014  ORF Transcript_55683/g.109014 Transcript_55683/m.109014 type:complete len:217 (+) Transcript_55683:102-752(+)|eukprot:Cvel_16998.t1-p1 / transcript=Cvel_16998.t1 / gene=Cvel_16998 / organism=Chromera_velia_CCMP2878 / gene_product=Fucoxanthin-chlorophyll a-c binding protein,, putative / transcript_product=Fucoxanthin-chlorophyll a-c binding protein,, putative / location=Cvel_scaffold1335:47477-48729(+) / protein_length=216 / sequence_SO=supercontig / SO=protein_coding / is_pseudo=false
MAKLAVAVAVSVCLSGTSAFQPLLKSATPQRSASVTQAAYDYSKVEGLPGASEPFLPYFGYTPDSEKGEQLKRYREAELKHGRLAMMATLGFFVVEGLNFHPLFPKVEGIAINQYQQLPGAAQAFLALCVGLIEGINIEKGWKDPRKDADNFFTLEEDFEPGTYNWDPAKFITKYGLEDAAKMKEMKTKELNNGRLAMIGIAGMIVQESLTGKPIF